MVIKIKKNYFPMVLTLSQRSGEYKQLIDRYISKVITECGLFYTGYIQGKLVENSGDGHGRDVL